MQSTHAPPVLPHIPRSVPTWHAPLASMQPAQQTPPTQRPVLQPAWSAACPCVQTPVAHEAGVQSPPLGHEPHALPPLPQSETVVPATQLGPLSETQPVQQTPATQVPVSPAFPPPQAVPLGAAAPVVAHRVLSHV